jgi:hypothetical protein
MPACLSCDGNGSVYHQESDEVTVSEACYHCAGSGEVESEVDRHDRLMRVAYALAYQAEIKCRNDRNSDPEGEGYDFAAAENMLTVEVYFQDRVLDRQYKFMDQLNRMDYSIQDILLEWNEKPKVEAVPSPNGAVAHSEAPAKVERIFEMSSILGDDDIPF